MCVNDFCLVNSVASGTTGFSITISMCVCQIDEECKKETERQIEGEESEGDKSSQGVLGGVWHHLFLKQFISTPPLLLTSFRCTSGVPLSHLRAQTPSQALDSLINLLILTSGNFVPATRPKRSQLFGLKMSKYHGYTDHSFF